jgi:monovalent cation/proton antiporter MnhG/PhaG subunit
VIHWIVLAVGCALELVSVLGLVTMRNVYDRLHYVGLAGYGALLVAIAVFLTHPFSLIGDKSLLTGVLLVGISPIVAHATARSFRGGRAQRARPGDAGREPEPENER